MSQPLAGVRILDLTRLLPGGVCTMMLADLGADVLKIEDPNGGDYARWMPPLQNDLSVFFRMNNRNKRAAIIDLKHAEGVAVLKRLVEKADVLVEGFRPGVMARLGCGYDDLKTLNPKLVYCAISGWGADGPYVDRGGHDVNYVSIAGIPGSMETPQVLGAQIGDIAGAYMAMNGIMAALFRRERTGEGAFVDVSLFESSLPFALQAWIEAQALGTKGGEGGLSGGNAFYRIYRARDGKTVSLAAMEPKFWGNFCTAVERPDLIADYILPERQKYLRAELEELFALKTADEWATHLKDVDCCFALVNPPEALGNDPHVQARGLVGRGADNSLWMRTPLRIDGMDFAPGSVPGYGEHTRAALQEAGYTAAEIDVLVSKGVVKVL